MRLPGLVLLFASAACAQVSDGITTYVSRTVNIAADEADFSVVATAALDTTQQQVTQIFRDAGVENLNVVAVAAGQNTSTYPPPGDSQFFYQIAFSVAPPAMKDFAKRLDGMRASLPAGLTGLQYTAVQAVSPAALDAARQTALPQLLADARAKAQSLANAAGLKLGAVQGVSDTAYAAGGLALSSWISVGAGFTSSSSTGSSSGTQYTFNATVKFAAQ